MNHTNFLARNLCRTAPSGVELSLTVRLELTCILCDICIKFSVIKLHHYNSSHITPVKTPGPNTAMELNHYCSLTELLGQTG